MRLILTLLTILFAWPTHAQMTLRNGKLNSWSNHDSSLMSGLVAYYKLDETSGTRYDSIGGNNLTAYNSPSYTSGKVGNAATFVGASSQYLSTASTNLSLYKIDWTIAGWCYLSNKSALQLITSRGTGNGDEYALFYYTTADRFTIQIGDGTNINIANSDNFGSPSTLTWYFLAATYTQSSSNLTISVNAGTPNSTTVSYFPSSTNGETALGYYRSGVGGNKFPLTGAVDEIGYWKRVLSQAEISTLYKSGLGTTYPTFSHRSRRIPESLYETPANPLLAALYRKPEPISLDIP